MCFGGWLAGLTRLSQKLLYETDPNGTYLSFLGWPYLRASFLAIARGLVSSG